MFKLSLAFSFVSLSTGALTLTDYCAKLAAQCPGQSLTADVCATAMGTTPLGTLLEENMDSIACRLKFLEAPAFNTTQSCRYAGPSGGGRCGSLVTNVCRIATNVCSGKAGTSYADEAACMDPSTGLASIGAHWGSKQGVAAAGDNSLECRIYHAIASQTTNNDVHCSHFGAATSGVGASPCSGLVAPDPAHYCDLLEYNCKTPETQQYTNKDQCLAAVVHLPTNATDTAQASNSRNTLGCRVYHAQAANVLTVDHCGHAGPAGGGVCGSELQAWGSILQNTCADSSVQTLVDNVSPTIINAAFPPGYRTAPTTSQAKYTSVLDQIGNTQACRIYHLGVAASVSSHCVHGDLSGANACGTVLDSLCLFIQQTCGFGTAAYQFDDMANCKADLTNTTDNVIQVSTGPYPDGAANSYTCRFYHTYVAATYLAGGASAGVANAAALNQQHCGHVLKVPIGPGGCAAAAGASAAPTPAGASGAPTAAGASRAPSAAGSPSAGPNTASASALSIMGSATACVVGLFAL